MVLPFWLGGAGPRGRQGGRGQADRENSWQERMCEVYPQALPGGSRGPPGGAVWAGKGLFRLLWLDAVFHFLTPHSPGSELS